MKAMYISRILRATLMSAISVGLIAYVLTRSRTIAFTAEAYIVIVWLGLGIAIWWCDGHGVSEYRHRVWRNVSICALATYLSCVVGYILGTVLAHDEFASGLAPSLPSIVEAGFILPIHLIAIVPAALSGFVLAQTTRTENDGV